MPLPSHLIQALLPSVQILALSLPPFPNRAIYFVPLIIGLVFASATNLQGYSNELRAALISQWPWYLGTIQQLLSSQSPEKQYWPVNDPNQTSNLKFGWSKFYWAISLWCNPRGIKWSHQIRGLRRGFAPHTKSKFIFHQLKWMFLCYLAVDYLGTYTDRHFYRPGVDTSTLTVRADSWTRSFYNTFHILAQVNCQLQYQYYCASLLTVLLGISRPEDWPPWLGRIEDVTLVRKYWNGFCHQIIRRVFVGYSSAFVSFMRLQPRTRLAHYAQSYASFTVSAFFHGLTTCIMPYTTKHTLYDRFGLYFVFFIMQGMACQAEDIVLHLYNRRMANKKIVAAEAKPGDERKRSPDISVNQRVISTSTAVDWKRILGYVWVIGWFWFSMRWAADAMLRSEVSHLSPLPVSVVGPALDWAMKTKWIPESLIMLSSPDY